MNTYENLVPTLKEIFPEFTGIDGYIAENESLPYAFVADLLDHLRDEFKEGKIVSDDPKMEKMFSLITELESLPRAENKEIVPAGFFESMLYGEPSDKFFIDAAKKYLNDDMWHLFRIVQTQHVGDAKDFIDTEAR
ncbi:hypothetical protein HY418_02315 [Candidatus Kaiserbacteria bacterium]|nr:hypothetical protein [Candidatus Kaiserbacteria bacterium]